MAPYKILAFIGSAREGRMAERVVTLVKNHYIPDADKAKYELEFLDPEELNLPICKQPLHFHQDPTQAPEILHEINKKVQNADAYLIVSAEYNRTLPPGLTNTIDYIPPPSFGYKPCGIICYSMGPQGGVVAACSSKPFLSEIGCLPIQHFVAIAQVHKEVTAEGTTANSHILSSLSKSFKQLSWYTRALKNMRDTEGVPQ